MYHFLRKHRYWLAALALITAGALFYFQAVDDDDPFGPPNNPNQQGQAEEAIAE